MSRTSFYSRNYVGWPPVHIKEKANPESAYWEERASAQLEQLREKLSSEEWSEFKALVDLEHQTWKRVWELAIEANKAHRPGMPMTDLAQEVD